MVTQEPKAEIRKQNKQRHQRSSGVCVYQPDAGLQVEINQVFDLKIEKFNLQYTVGQIHEFDLHKYCKMKSSQGTSSYSLNQQAICVAKG